MSPVRMEEPLDSFVPTERTRVRRFVRGPTEAQLIEALETLQKAAGNELEPNETRLGP
jgi:hypothetical protein